MCSTEYPCNGDIMRHGDLRRVAQQRPPSALSSPGPVTALSHRDENQALFRERCQEAKALGMVIVGHKQVSLFTQWKGVWQHLPDCLTTVSVQ